jgi:FkbH-like protein
MDTPAKVFSENPSDSFMDCLSLGKKLEKLNSQSKLKVDSTINIAILSSSSMNGIKEVLIAKCSSSNIFANIHMGEYAQYAQDILDNKSDLYSFNADLVIINIDFNSLAEDYGYRPYAKSADERRIWVREASNILENFANEVCSRSSAKVLLHNFEVPIYSPLGIIDQKEEYGFIESIEDVNRNLRNKYKRNNQVFIYDFNGFCSNIGKAKIIDPKMLYFADIKVKIQFIPDLCSDYFKYIQSLAFKTKKCIVLDLDNTLWGGIIGESGIEGIHLGPNSEGRSFLEFQKYLLALYDRGIILAINSKNNESDAMEVIKNHPYMVLREKCFAAIRINWQDKVANLKSLADEINIGLDSMVFFDDDPVNRDMVEKLLPDVTVVDLPKDFSLYSSTLKNLNYFDTLTISNEDIRRGELYQAEKRRSNLLKNTSGLDDYLRSLNINVYIEIANKNNISRIAQLTQKTNQFNLTTKRYSEENIQDLSESNDFQVFSLRAKDKFGDNGVTGVAIIKINNINNWHIETFLLSCRIIGRKIEEALLAHIIKEAKAKGVENIFGYFVDTKKNLLVKDFYQKNGFTKFDSDYEGDVWIFKTKDRYLSPDYIKYKFL